MAFLGRLIAGLIILAILPFHALAPAVKISQVLNLPFLRLFTGADPLITAYVDAGWPPLICLIFAILCLVGAVIGLFMRERWAAYLIFLAAIADALSLYFAETMGFTSLGLGFFQILGLGAFMVLLWVLVRGTTRRV